MAAPIDMPDFTRWWRERPVDTKIYDRSGNLAAVTGEVIADLIGHDIVLERLCMGCDHQNIQLYVSTYNPAGVLYPWLRIPSYDGLGTLVPSPIAVHICDSDIFEEMFYDQAHDWYVIALKRPLRFTHGIQLLIYNPEAFLHHVTLGAVIQDKGVIP